MYIVYKIFVYICVYYVVTISFLIIWKVLSLQLKYQFKEILYLGILTINFIIDFLFYNLYIIKFTL